MTTSMWPPDGVNFTALVSRFQNTCCRRPASPRATGLGVESDAQPQLLRLDRKPHRIDGGIDHLHEIDRLHVELHFPRDDAAHVEQVRDDLRLHSCVALDGLDAAEMVFAVRLQALEESRPAEDRVERRAQLVRDRREEFILEPAHALGFFARGSLRAQHFFTLGLQLLHIGDVHARADIARELAAGIFEQRRRLLDDPTHGAVRLAQAVLATKRLARVEARGVGLQALREIVFVDVLCPAETLLLFGLPAGEFQPDLVEPDPRLGVIRDPDEHGRRVRHEAETFVAVAQGVFGALLLRDVARDLRCADDFPGRVAHRRYGERDVD